MKYSLIIPVYNRPDEVDELLQSIAMQTYKDMEVIVVEDGSSVTCADVVQKYAKHLDLKYFQKPNSGPGQSRNYGAERSQGEYIYEVHNSLSVNWCIPFRWDRYANLDKAETWSASHYEW